MRPSRRAGRRVPPKGRSLRSDPRPLPSGDDAAETVEAVPSAAGTAGVRPGSRAANRAAKRSVSGVRPKAGVRGGSGRRRSGSSTTGLVILAVGAVAIAAAVLLLGNPFGSPTASPSASLIVGDGTCPTTQPAALPAGETRTVTITTPKGNIVVKVDGSLSPIAAGNFVALVTCHFYDGSTFHRTASLSATDPTPFVIQGGAAKAGTGSIPYSIQDEPVTATYRRGTVAMARTSNPNSQTSQFFIVMDDKAAPPLVSYNTYAIFGEVISGMDVADAIFQASGGVEEPADPIPMTSVVVGPGPAATPSPGPTAGPSQAASPAGSTAPTSAPTTAP